MQTSDVLIVAAAGAFIGAIVGRIWRDFAVRRARARQLLQCYDELFSIASTLLATHPDAEAQFRRAYERMEAAHQPPAGGYQDLTEQREWHMLRRMELVALWQSTLRKISERTASRQEAGPAA